MCTRSTVSPLNICPVPDDCSCNTCQLAPRCEPLSGAFAWTLHDAPGWSLVLITRKSAPMERQSGKATNRHIVISHYHLAELHQTEEKLPVSFTWLSSTGVLSTRPSGNHRPSSRSALSTLSDPWMTFRPTSMQKSPLHESCKNGWF